MTTEEIRCLLVHVSYPGWEFVIGEGMTEAWLQVQFRADGQRQYGRKWRLSQHMTRSEVVQTALKAVLTAVEHEAREHFTYRGKPIFSPHHDVDALHELFPAQDKRVAV